jgi:hypothetical protein
MVIYFIIQFVWRAHLKKKLKPAETQRLLSEQAIFTKPTTIQTSVLSEQL